ncbi:MAG: hypothetical protein PHW96_04410 [Candidatus Nanoarchaeia archaeon]|nr:hypothetical protein [Candidatus Nanoarchaeia archaeon]
MEKPFQIMLFVFIAIVVALTLIIILAQGNVLGQESFNNTLGLIDWRIG